MNTDRFVPLCLIALALASGAVAPLIAADSTPAPDAVGEAFSKGKVSLNVRARYEGVDQAGLREAEAYTLRTRLGFTTAPIQGLKAMIEAENIVSPAPDRYSQAGINPGGAGRAVVADPESTEINQAWLAFSSGAATVTAGRQRLVLDNTRFVGDVGWRQNMQTFDAITLVAKPVEKLNVTYSYLNRINRVFSDKHPQGNWDSDSHVLNGSYAGFPIGTLTGYAYLLDFDNAATNSSSTVGASLTGTPALNDALKLSYRIEYATQSDYGSNPQNYSTDYYTGEIGVVAKRGSAAIGYEVLGTDNNVGFKTPLATLHAFNGWTDVFLATPNGGLRDAYAKVGANLPAGFSLLAFYHQFETDTGVDLGEEWDVQLTRKFGKYFTGLIKYADFNRDSLSVPEVRKVWVQVEFNY